MKFTRFIPAVVMASCLVSASAQQQTQDASTAEAQQPIASVTVTARRFHMEPAEFKDYEYAYNLSNGEVVHFSRRVGRFFVAIKGQPSVEIFPTAADQFKSKGGAIMVFTDDGDKLKIDRYEVLQNESGMRVAALSGAPK
jgi:hypothetical protein